MKKDIYFIVREGVGSHYLMGHVLSKYCGGISVDLVKGDLESIYNSNIVLIKNCIGDIYNDLYIDKLRKRGNKIIYYVGDQLSTKKDEFLILLHHYSELYDLVLWPSKQVMAQMSNITNNDYLYHIWDPKIIPNDGKEFSICYCGTLRDSKAKLCTGLNIIEIYSNKIVESLGYKYRKAALDYSELSKHSMHYSYRKKESPEYWFGTNTKLSTAAASNANILLSKDVAFLEILPEYDYYCEEFEDVIGVISKAKDDFNTKKWYDNLDKLTYIKELTSCEKISKELTSKISKLW